MVLQSGTLAITGNAIRSFTPVNFWNPIKQIVQTSPGHLTWESVTSGGLAGMILELYDYADGTVELALSHVRVRENISSIGLEPNVYEYGGLHKMLQIYRLPPKEKSHKYFEFNTVVRGLRKGDNPIFIRVDQEDGHIAWTSPIYVVRDT